MAGEHAFRRIVIDLENSTIDDARLIVFFGQESFLSRWASEKVTEKYVNAALTSIDFVKLGPEATVDDIISHTETLPMGSKKRVVLVKDSPLLASQTTTNEVKVSRSEHDIKRLVKYISSLPETALLIFESESVDKRKSLYKAMTKVGLCYEFDKLESGDLNSFIIKRFKAAGKTISREMLNEIVNATGYFERDSEYRIQDLENDIRKIVAHSEKADITHFDVAAAIEASADTNVFAMLDAISQGRKEVAFEILNNILGKGENAYRLLSLITSQLEIMLAVKEMQEEGKNLYDMQSILGIHEFRVKKAANFTRSFTKDNLVRGLSNAFNIDKDIKSGLYPETLALEMFIAEL